MPPHPQMPNLRRNLSTTSIDLSSTSPRPQNNGGSSEKSSFSRQSSQHLIRSPISPRPQPLHDRSCDLPQVNSFDDFEEPSGREKNSSSFGNLADELADFWDEEAQREEMPQMQFDGQTTNERSTVNGDTSDEDQGSRGDTVRPSTVDNAPYVSSHSPQAPQEFQSRRPNSEYCGSNCGDDSELENADGVLSSLEFSMAAVESLASKDAVINGSNIDNVIHRILVSLKHLPSQSGVENGTSRLIASNIALTSHLTNQARTLTALAHPLISPLTSPPRAEVIEELIPLLTILLASLPTPSAHCFSLLRGLQHSTHDLQSTLTYLSDTIHMTRQALTSSSRKLRSVLEMVLQIRREAEVRDEAIRWIDVGAWDQRLAGREYARICGEVVCGFEKVCNGWRERLIGEVGAA